MITIETPTQIPSGSHASSCEEDALLCVHCGQRVPSYRSDGFCCQGCLTVHDLLVNRGLSHYYEIRDRGPSLRKPIAAVDPSDWQKFQSYDDPEFMKLMNPDYRDGEVYYARFFLEGVHCAACIWLVEKTVEWTQGVAQVRLDLGSSIASVQMQPGGKLSEIAAEFQKLGYRPHLVKWGEEIELQKKADRKSLIQIGVAGAATGNIMLMAVSLYGGATGSYAELFRWISFVFFMPVFFYSSVPFYRSALSSMRLKSLSIDVPIVLGILLGTASSVYNLFSGSEHIYFDSLAALVFLLLVSRWVLKRSQLRATRAQSILSFLTPMKVVVKLKGESQFRERSLDQVVKGSQVKVLAGSVFPVDGTVLEGSSAVDYSLLTGESRGVRVLPGSKVFAGTVNQDAPLVIRVEAAGATSRLGQILSEMEASIKRKAPIRVAADRVARVYVAAVTLAVLVGLVVGWKLGFQEGLNRALALALVTCPCALALATPLSFLRAIGALAERGILVKGEDTLERLARAKTLFFDKTGTLTEGRMLVRRIRPVGAMGSLHREWIPALLALESQSRHPIARAIVQHCELELGQSGHPGQIPSVDQFKETIGRGVEGWVGGTHWSVERSGLSISEATPEPSSVHASTALDFQTEVAVKRTGEIVAVIELGDRLKAEAANEMQQLRSLGYRLVLMTGDQRESALRVGKSLGFAEDEVLWTQTPEQKSERVRCTPDSVMIGDGANDSIALASAAVGVAVQGGVELSLRASDVYFSGQNRSGVRALRDLLLTSREAMKVVWRNFIFSGVYNLAGAVAAVAGWMDPLIAALVMPMSALTVFLSAQWGSSVIRKGVP